MPSSSDRPDDQEGARAFRLRGVCSQGTVFMPDFTGCAPTAGLKCKITKTLRFQRPKPEGAAWSHILVDEWQGEH